MYGGYNDDHGVFSDFYRYSLVNDDYITNGWKKVDSINDGPGSLQILKKYPQKIKKL